MRAVAGTARTKSDALDFTITCCGQIHAQIFDGYAAAIFAAALLFGAQAAFAENDSDENTDSATVKLDITCAQHDLDLITLRGSESCRAAQADVQGN